MLDWFKLKALCIYSILIALIGFNLAALRVGKYPKAISIIAENARARNLFSANVDPSLQVILLLAPQSSLNQKSNLEFYIIYSNHIFNELKAYNGEKEADIIAMVERESNRVW